jgi:alkane 1-monooxygenase
MPFTKKWGFFTIHLFAFLPLLGFYLGGIFNYLSFGIIFLIIPIIDYFIRDNRNPTGLEEEKLKNDWFFKFQLLIYVPLQLSLLCFGLYVVKYYDLSVFEWIGFTLSLGLLSGGAGITLAHELMHKNDKVQQLASKIILSTVCYGHFFIEHVKGHHVTVATPHDPATARLGESIYHFIPRTIVGSFLSAWRLEKRRLKARNLSFYNIRNHFYWIIFAPLSIAVLSYLYAGIPALIFFLVQSFAAVLLLEVVNYIEHYGLTRKMLENGHYEKVNHTHSWNSNHWLSNLILFHLQRHSDHHANGAKPFQILKTIDDSPQLPSSYLGLYLITFVPPLWRAIMDKRVLAYQNK